MKNNNIDYSMADAQVGCWVKDIDRLNGIDNYFDQSAAYGHGISLCQWNKGENIATFRFTQRGLQVWCKNHYTRKNIGVCKIAPNDVGGFIQRGMVAVICDYNRNTHDNYLQDKHSFVETIRGMV
jgi:hypothetical protein